MRKGSDTATGRGPTKRQGFFSASVRQKPARTFWNKEDKDHDENGVDTLSDHGDSPGPVVVDLVAQVDDDSGGNSTTVPSV